MTTQEFIKYAGERPELCEKLIACTTPEEAYAIAEAEGLTDDMDTFVNVMTETKKEIDSLKEADLENVQAAATTGTIVSYVASVSGATAMAASLAV